MRTDSLDDQVRELDAPSRALLELSLLRGIADEELAGLLGVGKERVRERRDAVFHELGAESEDERASVAAVLRGEEPGAQGAVQEAERPLERLPAELPRSRRRALRTALIGGLAIAVVVAVALALDDDGGPMRPAPAPRAEPSPPVSAEAGGPAAAELSALGGGPWRGSAQLVGRPGERRLRLVVRGLPDLSSGGYVVWLYDSLSEVQPVTGVRRGSFAVEEPLPRSAERYRFLDVSREPADGNPNHSGESVLRVPLARIR